MIISAGHCLHACAEDRGSLPCVQHYRYLICSLKGEPSHPVIGVFVGVTEVGKGGKAGASARNEIPTGMGPMGGVTGAATAEGGTGDAGVVEGGLAAPASPAFTSISRICRTPFGFG